MNPQPLPFFPARKYPTLANVEKKKEEEAKRRASGQVLKTKNFRYNAIINIMIVTKYLCSFSEIPYHGTDSLYSERIVMPSLGEGISTVG